MPISSMKGLFVAEGWDEGSESGQYIFLAVTFQRDFGKVKKGDMFDSIFVDHNAQVIKFWNQAEGLDYDDKPDGDFQIEYDTVARTP